MDIVIVDDIEDNCAYLKRVFGNYDTVAFTDPFRALDYCIDHDFDILITDQKMPDMTGIELVKKISPENSDFLAIVISAYTDSDDLLDAINSNLIHKFILKPFLPDQILVMVNRAYETLLLIRRNIELEQLLHKENKVLKNYYRQQHKSRSEHERLIGDSEMMKELEKRLTAYASCDQPVLITGETGTGKELAARILHRCSSRSGGPFIAVNCSAFSETLWESDFFGHEKGAFSGAATARKGLFEQADGGVLFLDEIGEMPEGLQVKFLRMIQFGTFRPLGSAKERSADVRLVCATNRNLQQEVQTGGFRKDLYFRISSLLLEMPPLRERRMDILLLYEELKLREGIYVPELTEDAVKTLTQYDFPGNVRELENVIWQLHIHYKLEGDEKIGGQTMRKVLRLFEGNEPGSWEAGSSDDSEKGGYFHSRMEKTEKELISNVFRENGQNITRTASALGLSRQGLKNKLKKYEFI